MCAVSKRKSIARTSLLKTLLFTIVIFFLGKIFDPYNQGQLAVVLMLFIAVLSITLLTGSSGQISLGQGALMAVGGYAMALLVLNVGLDLWLGVLLSIPASSLAGLLLGIAAARLSGPYLAGTTLVVALAIPTLANRFESVLAGDLGLIIDFGATPAWVTSLFGELGYEQWQLYFVLPFAALALFFALNIFASRIGRSWRALRDHEIAASLMGVESSKTRILVFVVSSGFAGLAGALYGLRGIVGPSVYPVSLSLTLLTAAILGGIRTIGGAFVGSVLVVFLPDWIESLTGGFELSTQISDYLPAVVSGILLIATVVINPAGVVGGFSHKKRH
jgi:branched-chain amino acid transport system permease protein